MIPFIYFLKRNIKLLPTIDTINLVCDGDSLTAPLDSWSYKLRNFIATKTSDYTFHSFGVGGQTMASMISDFSTQIAPCVIQGKTNVIIYWEDMNQLLNADNMFNYAKQYGQLAKDAGFDIIIVMNSYYVRSPYPSYIYDSNNAILGQYADMLESEKSIWNYHVDIRKIDGIGSLTYPTDRDGVYFTNDSIHCTQAGQQKIADHIITNVLPLFFKF
jgi:hypothetical protein